MRGGRLDKRITIQSKTVTQKPSGQEIATWAAIAHRRAASVSFPTRDANEQFTADQFVAKQLVEFRIRWSAALYPELNALCRIVYPPPSNKDAQSPDEDTIYDVHNVAELGRKDGFLIKATRRSEQ